MKKVLNIIILLVILIILIIAGLTWQGYILNKEGASVVTSKTEYNQEENPKVTITNNSKEKICFSSCYPYHLERNSGGNEGFKSYQYGSCSKKDVADICIEPNEVKAFELILDGLITEKGLHRIAVPACISCALQENFKKDEWLYSNEFVIK